MSNVIRINSCLYSRMGYGRNRNTSDFYMNGRFQSEAHLENVQAFMENRSSEYLFSVAENMENTADSTAAVSVRKDMSRLQEKFASHSGDLQSKMKEFSNRISGSARMLQSILEMNHTPAQDDRRRVGFSGLLLTEGHFVALTSGLGRAYHMREGTFTAIARENSKRVRLVNLGVLTEEDSVREDLHIPKQNADADLGQLTVVSEPLPIYEDDTFLLISDGVFEALGEERIEDIIAGEGDSSFLASRLINESMKRKSIGDLTALVVRVEKIYDVQGASRRPMIRSRVDALSKTPAVAYKYNRKSVARDNVVFFGLLGLIGVVFATLLYVLFTSLIGPNDTSDRAVASPPPIAEDSATPNATPEPNADPTPLPAEQPAEATEAPATPDTYVVKSGDTLSGIVRTLYNDLSLIEAFQDYNGITNPNQLSVGMELKVPDIETLRLN